jgi:shikimate 5-dehydrogenase
VVEVVEDLKSLTKARRRVKCVMSTLPAGAGFELPEELVEENVKNKGGMICFDANYKPYTTKFLAQAERSGCDVIRGSEMFYEQGARQFELWFGRQAPVGVMKQLVLDACKEE